MNRRMVALLLVLAVAGAMASPVEAKKKRKSKPKPVVVTYNMAWVSGCGGSGYLTLKGTPSPDPCALYFPELGNSYSFPAIDGKPFKLNAKKPITVDFTLSTVAHVQAEFEAVLDADVSGKSKTIASATQTVTGQGDTAMHFDLEPDAALDKGKIDNLNLTISWTNGVAYSQINFEAGAPVVINGFK
jgi:hypothetical protein